jgi:hypothetical protein
MLLRRMMILIGLLSAASLLSLVPLDAAGQANSGIIGGTVRGKLSQQLVLPVPDQPRHVLGLAEANGTYDGPTAMLMGAAVRTVEKWDLVGGTGDDLGFMIFTIERDQLVASYTGTVRPAEGGRVLLSGQMRFQSGSGRYAGVQGEATYTGVADKESFELRLDGKYKKE